MGDLWVSQLQEQSLFSLELVEGTEVGVVLPDDFSPGTGLAIVLRKSVYAVGGVMGVLISSCLMKSAKPVRGVRAERADSSEGKVEDTGVLSCASLGLVVEPIVAPVKSNERPIDQENDSEHKRWARLRRREVRRRRKVS